MNYKWVPIIFNEQCTGCGLCVDACGPKCLEIADSIAALARPNECGSEEHCIGVCNDAAIQMAWVPMERNHSRGKWREEVKDCVPQ